MTIKIVTDSTCDLPPDVIEALDITLLPLYIHIGEQDYRDGIDMTRQAFYEQLPHFATHPTTATPGAGLFTEAYQRLADAGAAEILSIHISKSLSATVDVARIAAQEFKAAAVTVLDSGQLSLGMGFLVESAARAAAEGKGMSEIVALIEEQGSRTHVFAAIDTLEYLRRSGRMNGIVAGLGSILQIKPILKMHQGVADSERVRTNNGASKRMLALLDEIGPIERAALVHTHSPAQAEALRSAAAALLPADIASVDITPVLGAHLGPGAVGFAVVSAK